jgi:N-carbamoylputrescine amidase
MTLKIAVAQLDATPLAVQENARHGAEAIARAAADGAKLVVLPELQNTGYVLDPERLRPLAERADAPGPALGAWQAAAREHRTAVVAGFTELGEDGELYDSAAAWDSSGRLAGVYRKLHLFAHERDAFAPGDRGLPVVELDGVKVGMLICYDLRFPEALRVLALQGAQVIAVPAAWVAAFDQRPPDSQQSIGQVDAALVQANLSQVFVAAADRVGEDEGVAFLGRSVVASPYGNALLGPLDASTERIEVVEVDLEDAARAQERSDTIHPRRDRRDDVYGSLLGYSVNGTAPAAPTPEEVLAEIERKRGYVLDMHKILAHADPQFLESYEAFLEAAYLRQRSLTRREKEFVYVAALTALASPHNHIVAHLKAGLNAGATPGELLEVLQQVLPPAGVPRFMHALDAWKEVCAPLMEGVPSEASPDRPAPVTADEPNLGGTS